MTKQSYVVVNIDSKKETNFLPKKGLNLDGGRSKKDISYVDRAIFEPSKIKLVSSGYVVEQ